MAKPLKPKDKFVTTITISGAQETGKTHILRKLARVLRKNGVAEDSIFLKQGKGLGRKKGLMPLAVEKRDHDDQKRLEVFLEHTKIVFVEKTTR